MPLLYKKDQMKKGDECIVTHEHYQKPEIMHIKITCVEEIIDLDIRFDKYGKLHLEKQKTIGYKTRWMVATSKKKYRIRQKHLQIDKASHRLEEDSLSYIGHICGNIDLDDEYEVFNYLQKTYQKHRNHFY